MVWNFSQPLCRYLYRHRNKLIFTGVFVGGVVGSLKLAEYTIAEFFAAEQRNAAENQRKLQTFNQIHQHSLALAEAMLDSVIERLEIIVDTDAITRKLKTSQGNKVDLWNELKIRIFTKISTAVFVVPILLIVVQTQLNQISGYTQSSTETDEQQEEFLSTPHKYLLEGGIEKLVLHISGVAKNVTGTMPLQCPMNSTALETIIRSICSSVMSDTSSGKFSVINYVFPQKILDLDVLSSEDSLEDNLNFWFMQTLDILDSPDCMRVFVHCISESISSLGNEMQDSIAAKTPNAEEENNFSEVPSLPLAKTLPLLNAKLKSICSKRFLTELSSLEIFQKFISNIYDSFLSVF